MDLKEITLLLLHLVDKRKKKVGQSKYFNNFYIIN